MEHNIPDTYQTVLNAYKANALPELPVPSSMEAAAEHGFAHGVASALSLLSEVQTSEVLTPPQRGAFMKHFIECMRKAL